MEIIKQAAQNFDFTYFAMVMATGIVSIACHLLGVYPFDWLLFWLNVLLYPILWFLAIYKVIRFPTLVFKDFISHDNGPAFLAIVAATSTLGSQVLLLGNVVRIALLLWMLGLIFWAVLLYLFLTFAMTGESKPSLEKGINGGWLVIVVATQSIAVLATGLSSFMGSLQDSFLFVALCFFLLGCMLYIVLISLIFYRLVYFRLTQEEFTPPYWIAMGGTAITTLAGASLIQAAGSSAFISHTLPFLEGFVLFFWVTGTWWIPLLVILGAWRHVIRRYPFQYTPKYWDIVFPLGMYSTCTVQLSQAASLPFLSGIARGMVYVALFAWMMVTAGLVHHMWLSGTGLRRKVA